MLVDEVSLPARRKNAEKVIAQKLCQQNFEYIVAECGLLVKTRMPA
jgi:hypothetical protein